MNTATGAGKDGAVTEPALPLVLDDPGFTYHPPGQTVTRRLRIYGDVDHVHYAIVTETGPGMSITNAAADVAEALQFTCDMTDMPIRIIEHYPESSGCGPEHFDLVEGQPAGRGAEMSATRWQRIPNEQILAMFGPDVFDNPQTTTNEGHPAMTDCQDSATKRIGADADPLELADNALRKLGDANDPGEAALVAQLMGSYALLSIAHDLRRMVSDQAIIHIHDCTRDQPERDDQMPEADMSEWPR